MIFQKISRGRRDPLIKAATVKKDKIPIWIKMSNIYLSCLSIEPVRKHIRHEVPLIFWVIKTEMPVAT